MVLSSEIKSAVDRRCFTIHVSDVHEQQLRCLVSMSDDLDENVKAAAMLTAICLTSAIFHSILSCQIIAH